MNDDSTDINMISSLPGATQRHRKSAADQPAASPPANDGVARQHPQTTDEAQPKPASKRNQRKKPTSPKTEVDVTKSVTQSTPKGKNSGQSAKVVNTKTKKKQPPTVRKQPAKKIAKAKATKMAKNEKATRGAKKEKATKGAKKEPAKRSREKETSAPPRNKAIGKLHPKFAMEPCEFNNPNPPLAAAFQWPGHYAEAARSCLPHLIGTQINIQLRTEFSGLRGHPKTKK